MRIYRVTRKNQKLTNHKELVKKSFFEGSALTKEEFIKLKEKYKAGKLRFNSEKVAKAMLNDPEIRKGLTK